MYIGIDLGGTKIAAGLVTKDGEIKFQSTLPTNPERGSEEVISDIIRIINLTALNMPANGEEIIGIGIGIPGHVIRNTNNLVYCVNLGWDMVDLKGRIERECRLPVYIENDAKAAALAEYSIGSLKGTQNSLLITLGTGVGGGVILNGKLYAGTNGKASEIGHMIVGENFYNCNCGQNGCYETFTSATALVKYTKKLLEDNKEETMILSRLKGNLDNLEAKVIFNCAREGDIIALKVIERFIHYLVIGISNLSNILDLEIIALGGGLSKSGRYLLELIEENIASNDFFGNINNAKIVTATLGNEAGIVGAAMLCRNNE